LGDYSKSSALISHLSELLLQQGVQITVRDLAADPVPQLDGDIATALRGAEHLSTRQQEAVDLFNKLIS
jgi:FMN-dependent NADH-azoreductase